MSRSQKKTPVGGVTGAETDKPFKLREHRRERRTVRFALKSDVDVPAPKEFGNPLSSEKDGKVYLDVSSYQAKMK